MDRNTYEDTGLEIEMVESSENSPFIPKEENIYNVNTMNNRKIIKNQNEDLSAEELALLNSSIVDHFIAALDKAKYIAPFTSLLCVLLALYITGINPLGGQKARKNVMSEEEFQQVRPVLSNEEMTNIYLNTMYAETVFSLPAPHYDKISLKFFTTAKKDGHFQPPDVFYEGVLFGITTSNSHNLKYTRRLLDEYDNAHNTLLNELKSDISNMNPLPSNIMDRSAWNNNTGWMESGIAVYYSDEDLLRQGMMSSDVHYPYKRVQEEILKIARKYKQIYITAWFPSSFGDQNPNSPLLKNNPNRHKVIIQQIVPTRTGLNNIKSTVVVWMSSKNYTEVTKPPSVIFV